MNNKNALSSLNKHNFFVKRKFLERYYPEQLYLNKNNLRITKKQQRKYTLFMKIFEKNKGIILAILNNKIAEMLFSQGKQKQAISQYYKILMYYPDYYNISDVLFTLGDLQLKTDIPEEFLFLLQPKKYDSDYFAFLQKKNRSFKKERSKDKKNIINKWKKNFNYSLKKKVQKKLFYFFEKNYALKKKIILDTISRKYKLSKFPEIHYLNYLAQGQNAIDNSNFRGGIRALKKARKIIPKNTLWDFYFKKLFGEVKELQSQPGAAFLTYYTAIRMYQPKYEYNKLDDMLARLVGYYERSVNTYKKRNNYHEAWKYYSYLIQLYVDLYKKGISRELVSKKAFKTFMDANNMVLATVTDNSSINLTGGLLTSSLDTSLSDKVRKFYDKHIKVARKYLNNDYIFARAYFNTQLGIKYQNYYEKNFMSTSNKSEILHLFKKAEIDFKWSFFANQDFADSYLMLGWMYQFIDEKKKSMVGTINRVKDKDEYEDLYEELFPGYLFEENIKMYKKSLSYFNNAISKNVLVSLHLNIANNYFLLNNFIKTENNYSDVINNIESNFSFNSELQKALFFFHLGKTYYFTDKYDKAIETLQKTWNYYEKMAPINVSNRKKLKENQKKREIILKYLAISSDLKGDSSNAIGYYKKILLEQNIAGVEYDRSVLLLEIARLKSKNREYDVALSYVKKAEKVLEDEDEVDLPDYPFYIKLFGVTIFSPNWLPFIGGGIDFVYKGDNNIAVRLATEHRYEYLYSLKASLYKKKGEFAKAIQSLNKLIDYAEDDDTRTGRETVINSYMRLGEIEFYNENFEKSKKAYNQVLEIAVDNKNIQLEQKVRKNLLMIVCYEIENSHQSIAFKKSIIQKELIKINNFQESYTEIKIETAREEIKKKNSDWDLNKKDILRVKLQSAKEIYNVLLYKTILNNYLKIFNKKHMNYSNLDKFIKNKKIIFQENKKLIEGYQGLVTNPKDISKKISFVKRNDYKLKMLLALNRGLVYQKLSLFSRAKAIYKEVLEDSIEFQTMLPMIIANFRLYQVNKKLSNQSFLTYLNKSFQLIKKYDFLIIKNKKLFSNIMNSKIQEQIEQKKYTQALILLNQKRQFLSWEAIKPYIKLDHLRYKGLFNKFNLFRKMFEKISEDIESTLLNRQELKNLEKISKTIEKKKNKLKKEILSNNQTRKIGQIIFYDYMNIDKIKNLPFSFLYILESEDGYHFFRKNNKKNIEYRKFEITNSELINFIQSNYNKNSLKSSKNKNQLSIFLQWMSKSVDYIFPDGEFKNFSFNKIFNKNVAQDVSFVSALLFQNNYGISNKNILNISAEVKEENQNIKNLIETNYSIETLKYQALLKQGNSLVDNNSFGLENIFSYSLKPNYVIFNYKNLNLLNKKELFYYEGGIKLLFSALGSSFVLFGENSLNNYEQLTDKKYTEAKLNNNFSGNISFFKKNKNIINKAIDKESNVFYLLAQKLYQNKKLYKAQVAIDRSFRVYTKFKIDKMVSLTKLKLRNKIYLSLDQQKKLDQLLVDYINKVKNQKNKDNFKFLKNLKYNYINQLLESNYISEALEKLKSIKTKDYFTEKQKFQIIENYFLSVLLRGKTKKLRAKLPKEMVLISSNFPLKYNDRLDFFVNQTNKINKWENILKLNFEWKYLSKNQSKFNKFKTRNILNTYYISQLFNNKQLILIGSDLEKEFYNFLLNPTSKELLKIQKTNLPLLYKEYAFFKYYLRKDNYSAAIKNLQNIEKATNNIKNSLILDNIYLDLIFQLKNRKLSSINMQKLVYYLHKSAEKKLKMKLINNQRQIFYQMLYSLKDILTKPRLVFVELEKIKRMSLNQFNKSIFNIINYFAFTLLPEYNKNLLYPKLLLTKFDKQIIIDINFLFKQKKVFTKVIIPKNKNQMNLLVEYFYHQKLLSKVLKAYLNYDKKTMTTLVKPMSYVSYGMFETYQDNIYSWNWDKKIQINQNKLMNIVTYKGLIKEKVKAVYYLPIKNNILHKYNLPYLDNVFYNTKFSTPDFRKSNQINVKLKWRDNIQDKKDSLNSILYIQLGRASKKKTDLIISKKLIESNAVIKVYSQFEKVGQFLSKLNTMKSRGWHLYSVDKNKKYIYISFLEIFLKELKKNHRSKVEKLKNYHPKSKIEYAYFYAKEKIKKKFLLADDYNSVILIRN